MAFARFRLVRNVAAVHTSLAFEISRLRGLPLPDGAGSGTSPIIPSTPLKWQFIALTNPD